MNQRNTKIKLHQKFGLPKSKISTIPFLLLFIVGTLVFGSAYGADTITVCASDCNYTTVNNAITGMWNAEISPSDYLCIDVDDVLDEFYVDCYSYNYNCSDPSVTNLSYYLCDGQSINAISFWFENEHGGFAPNNQVNFSTDYEWNYNDAFEFGYRYFTFDTSVMPVVQAEEANSGGYIYIYNTNLDSSTVVIYKNWVECDDIDCPNRSNDTTELRFDTNGFEDITTYAVGAPVTIGDDICDLDNWEQNLNSIDCEVGLTGMALVQYNIIGGAVGVILILGLILYVLSAEANFVVIVTWFFLIISYIIAITAMFGV